MITLAIGVCDHCQQDRDDCTQRGCELVCLECALIEVEDRVFGYADGVGGPEATK
jgi:hypothetical protein